jgi:hypothetical protein
MLSDRELLDEIYEQISRCVSIAKWVYGEYPSPEEERQAIFEISQLMSIIIGDVIELVDPEAHDKISAEFSASGELICRELEHAYEIFILTTIQKKAKYELLKEGDEFDGSESDAFDQYVLRRSQNLPA